MDEQIAILVNAGFTQFLSKMAEATDTWCALSTLSLREKNPAIKVTGIGNGGKHAPILPGACLLAADNPNPLYNRAQVRPVFKPPSVSAVVRRERKFIIEPPAGGDVVQNQKFILHF